MCYTCSCQRLTRTNFQMLRCPPQDRPSHWSASFCFFLCSNGCTDPQHESGGNKKSPWQLKSPKTPIRRGGIFFPPLENLQNLQSIYSYLFLAVRGAHLPSWVATVYCKVTDPLVTKSGSISADHFLLRGIRYLLIPLE